MYTSILLSVLLFLLLCCSNEENQTPNQHAAGAVELITGDQQVGVMGEILPELIQLKLLPEGFPCAGEPFYVEAKKMKGGGSVLVRYPTSRLNADCEGGVTTWWTRWTLGCDQPEQTAIFYLYNQGAGCDSSNLCPLSDSVMVTAFASKRTGWNVACGSSNLDLSNTKIREHNNSMYAVMSRSLYRATMKSGLWWEQVPGVPVDDIYDFGFTSSGRIYLLTWANGIYTSDDWQNWDQINIGIENRTSPGSLLVEDSVVYASFMTDAVYRLRPMKSNIWEKLSIEGTTIGEYRLVTRHPDGRLYLVDTWNNIWVSENSGQSWEKAPIGPAFTGYHVADLKISPSGEIYIGSVGGTLSIVNSETYTGTIKKYAESGSSSVSNILFYGDDVYYLTTDGVSTNIYSSSNGWEKVDVNFGKPIKHFAIDAKGEWVIGAEEAMYYFNE